ncbi:hypothetical protein PROFUN_02848 [Planoprotostelium fungivorum]|uniref:Transmembrane protein n=1 Tax=Planoprotostelium fungivorum TaxID=1890364 RepID=A0A2P6NRV4_9EUKA|nr:hypothetical protein PROFUN_02848 [Planoprotostelium fungivorum]
MSGFRHHSDQDPLLDSVWARQVHLTAVGRVRYVSALTITIAALIVSVTILLLGVLVRVDYSESIPIPHVLRVTGIICLVCSFLLGLLVVLLTPTHTKKHLASTDLFGEGYIGAWPVEDINLWTGYIRNTFSFTSSRMVFCYISTVILFCGGLIVYVGYLSSDVEVFAPGTSSFSIFCVLFLPFILLSILFLVYVGGDVLHLRWARHNKAFRTFVLNKRSIYWLGQLYILQPTGAWPNRVLWTVVGIEMTPTLYADVSVSSIRIHLARWAVGGRRSVYLEVPVPDEVAPRAAGWLQDFAGRYTTNVFIEPFLTTSSHLSPNFRSTGRDYF